MDKYDTCDLKSGLRKKFRQETYPDDSNKQNLVKRFNNTTAIATVVTDDQLTWVGSFGNFIYTSITMNVTKDGMINN